MSILNLGNSLVSSSDGISNLQLLGNIQILILCNLNRTDNGGVGSVDIGIGQSNGNSFLADIPAPLATTISGELVGSIANIISGLLINFKGSSGNTSRSLRSYISAIEPSVALDNILGNNQLAILCGNGEIGSASASSNKSNLERSQRDVSLLCLCVIKK